MISSLVQSAARDRLTAKQMREHGHPDWSLLVFHLTLEKVLKAMIVEAEQTPPYTHNLRQLADTAGLSLSDERQDWLDQITDSNLEACYPETKEEFYHKATPEFTAVWHERCEELYLWLTQRLKTKPKP